jgi:hypothetical protein
MADATCEEKELAPEDPAEEAAIAAASDEDEELEEEKEEEEEEDEEEPAPALFPTPGRTVPHIWHAPRRRPFWNVQALQFHAASRWAPSTERSM